MKKLMILLLLIPVLASADPQPWLKKENPNELYAHLYSDDDCPLSREDLNNLVNGVLVRSRIKQQQVGYRINRTSLVVRLNCIEKSESFWIFQSDVMFAKFSFHNTATRLMTTLMFGGYGTFGQYDKDGIDSSVRRSVENAITDYLKANLDLGEDE